MAGPPGSTSGRRGWLRDLQAVIGPRHVLTRPDELIVYETDGYTVERGWPAAVVLPGSAAEVVGVVRTLYAAGVPYIARGAGTGLSGGTIPKHGEVLISLARLNRLLEVDLDNLRAVVEPGYVNLHLSRAVAPDGLFYAPDPASQQACTLGGNVAENAGGPHCLKYGVTTNHVLGLEVVLPDGEVVTLGGKAEGLPGLDLVGLFVGSEGTLGIATRITVRLVPQPEATRTVLGLFDTVEDAAETVSAVIAAGIVPAAMEMLDNLAVQAVERGTYPVGYPPDVAAVLLIEVDGLEPGLDEMAEAIAGICRRHRVREVRVARSEAERARWWANRKTAFGAMGLLGPNYYVQDGVIPRAQLGPVLRTIAEVGRRYGLAIANVFHAGDGNLHPLIVFDARVPGETERVVAAGSEILRACVEAGGTISGEHGIGIEKLEDMRLLFTEDELELQRAIRAALDPAGLANPGKVFPTPGRCAEMAVAGPHSTRPTGVTPRG